MPFQDGNRVNPGGRPKAIAHVRRAAREQTDTAIRVLKYWMRQRKHPYVAVIAANSLLDRGWGRPAADPDSHEQLTITIRRIMGEGEEVQIVRGGNGHDNAPLLIEHDDNDNADG